MSHPLGAVFVRWGTPRDPHPPAFLKVEVLHLFRCYTHTHTRLTFDIPLRSSCSTTWKYSYTSKILIMPLLLPLLLLLLLLWLWFKFWLRLSSLSQQLGWFPLNIHIYIINIYLFIYMCIIYIYTLVGQKLRLLSYPQWTCLISSSAHPFPVES